MRFLVFDDNLSGHHLEYVHHLYVMARNDIENEYVFALPESFVKINSKMDWQSCTNISFDLFNSINNDYSTSILGQLKRSKNLCSQLSKIIKRNKIDVVFVNDLIWFVPFAPLYISSKVRLCGVIYRIYLYRDKQSSFVQKLLNRFKFSLMSKSKVFHRIFILNDEDSAVKLNSIYKTNKFLPLEDPVVPLPDAINIDFRIENNIAADDQLFIHFGGLAKRKGTLNILDSIALLSAEERKKYVFVFAGHIFDSAREEFYQKYNVIKDSARIIVKDEFCSYEYLASLCKSCDAIVCPYLDTSLSSGMLGYASQYQKPVIMPNSGLLGNLVSKNQLGYLMNDVSSTELIKAYKSVENKEVPIPSDEYSKINCVNRFTATILSNLKSFS